MPRGERIGDAWIKVSADGSTLADDLRRDLNEAGEDGGEEWAKGFKKGFNDKFDEDAIADAFDRAAGRLQGRLERLDLGTDVIRRKFEETFEGDLGKRMADNLIKDLEEGFRRFDAGSMFGDIDGQVRRAANEIVAINDARIKEMIDGDRRWAAEEERIRQANLAALKADIINRNKLEMQQAKLVADFQARMEKQKRAEIKATTDQMEKLSAEVERLIKGNARWGESSRDVNRKIRDLRIDMKNLGAETVDSERSFRRMRASLITLSPTLSRTNRQWNDMADVIGRITGRGSRNNFINFFGSVNRNFTRLVGTVAVGTARMIVGFGKFVKAIPEFFTDPKLLGQVFLNASGALVNLIPNLIAAGLAVAAFAAFAGLLSAALSGLLAIVSALAATISFALLGAVAALAGLLLPLVGTIGVVTGAFLSLSDAQKEALKADLKPLTNAFKDLGSAGADILFRDVGKWARDLAPVIDRLRPIVEGVATSIRDVLGGAIDSVTDNKKNGFDRFITTMRRTLPRAVESLGNAAVDALGGFGGIFRAIAAPGGILERFLGWLEDITSEFNDWANSVRGQRELREFFEEAGDSAAQLGDFLGAVTEALSELFDQARGTGDSIFEDMTNAVEDFIGFLQDNPDAIAQWLEDGQKLADSIGDAVVAVIDFIDAMDDPQTRETLRDILDIVTDIVGLISNIDPNILLSMGSGIITIVEGIKGIKGLDINWGALFDITPVGMAVDLVRTLWGLLQRLMRVRVRINFPNPFTAAQRALESFRRALSRLPGLIRRIPIVGGIFDRVIDGAKNLIRLVTGLPAQIRRIPSPPEIFRAVINAAQRLINLVGNIIGRLRDIVPVPNPFSFVISAASTLMGWLNNIADFFSRTFSLNVNWPDPPGFLDELGGSLAGLGNAVLPGDPISAGVNSAAGLTRGSTTSTSSTRGGRSVTVASGAITVVTPTKNPEAVAQEVLNRIVGVGY